MERTRSALAFLVFSSSLQDVQSRTPPALSISRRQAVIRALIISRKRVVAALAALDGSLDPMLRFPIAV